MLHQLQLEGLHLRYADAAPSAADDWRAASALISHAAPELRLAAVQLLSTLAHAAAPLEQPAAAGGSSCAALTGSAAPALTAVQQARVDAAFLSLCSAVSTDTGAAIRLEALLGLAGARHAQQVLACAYLALLSLLRMHLLRLAQRCAIDPIQCGCFPPMLAESVMQGQRMESGPVECVFVMQPNWCAALAFAAGMHHASRAVKQQALSKRAMLRMPGAAAAGQHGGTDAAAAAGVADGNLLDSATGAFVHGVEDDVVQVGCDMALELPAQHSTAPHACADGYRWLTHACS
jgi:hypothetical protein